MQIATTDQKNHEMIVAFLRKLSLQKNNLKSALALEHQYNIRKKYFTIDDLVGNPLCYGFLLEYCQKQHNSENLIFLRDVDEYRKLFSTDMDISLWPKDWRDVDINVENTENKVENFNSNHNANYNENCKENCNENLSSDKIWRSTVSKEVAEEYVEAIFSKYLHDDAQTQVCISKDRIERTMKRVKLLSVYGPTIFDEACIDPILTMTKDILPRFKVSNTVNRMVMRVASSEPPPPATDLPSSYEPSPGFVFLRCLP